jgi:amino acid transporter
MSQPAQPPEEPEAEPSATGSTEHRGGLMTLRGAVFLRIGAMVGAGIFALLGEAGAIAGAAVWISFLVAGLISLALGYGMAKLGAHYPSSGGLITYLIEGFGNGRLVGAAAWLGYVTAIVVVGAMVAVSFGDYAASIFTSSGVGSTWTKIFASALVVAAAWMCVVGPRFVDRVQSLIVVGCRRAREWWRRIGPRGSHFAMSRGNRSRTWWRSRSQTAG